MTSITFTSWHILYVDMNGELKELISSYFVNERGETLTAHDILENLNIEAQEFVAEIIRERG